MNFLLFQSIRKELSLLNLLMDKLQFPAPVKALSENARLRALTQGLAVEATHFRPLLPSAAFYQGVCYRLLELFTTRRQHQRLQQFYQVALKAVQALAPSRTASFQAGFTLVMEQLKSDSNVQAMLTFLQGQPLASQFLLGIVPFCLSQRLIQRGLKAQALGVLHGDQPGESVLQCLARTFGTKIYQFNGQSVRIIEAQSNKLDFVVLIARLGEQAFQLTCERVNKPSRRYQVLEGRGSDLIPKQRDSLLDTPIKDKEIHIQNQIISKRQQPANKQIAMPYPKQQKKLQQKETKISQHRTDIKEQSFSKTCDKQAVQVQMKKESQNRQQFTRKSKYIPSRQLRRQDLQHRQTSEINKFTAVKNQSDVLNRKTSDAGNLSENNRLQSNRIKQGRQDTLAERYELPKFGTYNFNKQESNQPSSLSTSAMVKASPARDEKYSFGCADQIQIKQDKHFQKAVLNQTQSSLKQDQANPQLKDDSRTKTNVKDVSQGLSNMVHSRQVLVATKIAKVDPSFYVGNSYVSMQWQRPSTEGKQYKKSYPVQQKKKLETSQVLRRHSPNQTSYFQSVKQVTTPKQICRVCRGSQHKCRACSQLREKASSMDWKLYLRQGAVDVRQGAVEERYDKQHSQMRKEFGSIRTMISQTREYKEPSFRKDSSQIRRGERPSVQYRERPKLSVSGLDQTKSQHQQQDRSGMFFRPKSPAPQTYQPRRDRLSQTWGIFGVRRDEGHLQQGSTRTGALEQSVYFNTTIGGGLQRGGRGARGGSPLNGGMMQTRGGQYLCR